MKCTVRGNTLYEKLRQTRKLLKVNYWFRRMHVCWSGASYIISYRGLGSLTICSHIKFPFCLCICMWKFSKKVIMGWRLIRQSFSQCLCGNVGLLESWSAEMIVCLCRQDDSLDILCVCRQDDSLDILCVCRQDDSLDILCACADKMIV